MGGVGLITVRYFALLREQRGQAEEQLETDLTTPADLYAQLQARYGFTLAPSQLRVAVNDRFAGWDSRLSPGDLVVFIPPVAGG